MTYWQIAFGMCGWQIFLKMEREKNSKPSFRKVRKVNLLFLSVRFPHCFTFLPFRILYSYLFLVFISEMRIIWCHGVFPGRFRHTQKEKKRENTDFFFISWLRKSLLKRIFVTVVTIIIIVNVTKIPNEMEKIYILFHRQNFPV